MAFVRESKEGDLESLAPRLRAADMKELQAHRVDAESALRYGFQHSLPCYTIEHLEQVIGMFGVAPHPAVPSAGMVWLLGSDEIGMKGVRTRFLRESRLWLEEIGKDFDLLCNQVHEENELHIRWLKFLGFTFINHKSPFIEFVRSCPCVIPPWLLDSVP
jgi:hypothetical protein